MHDDHAVLHRWPLLLVVVFICSASVMAAYEAVKRVGFPGITPVDSQLATVLFSAVVATALTAGLLVRYRLGMLIYDISSDAMLVTDPHNRIVDLNPAFSAITGYTLGELKGETPAVLSSRDHEDEPLFQRSWAELVKNDVWEGEQWGRRKNGERYALRGSVHVVRHPSGRVFRHVLQFYDTTDHKRQEEELKRREAEARSLSESLGSTFKELYTIMEANPDFLYVMDADGKLIRSNMNFAKFCGVPQERVLNRNATEFVYEEDRRDVVKGVAEAIKKGYSSFEVRFRRYDGLLVPYWCNAVVLTEPTGEVIGITGTGRDVSERKRDEDKIVHMATHDTLTGLPNRMLFSDRLQQALATDRRGRQRLAVLFVDLDKFKPVNDGYGHDVGDTLLQEVAKRLRNCVRESDVAARVGGDEFLVLLSSIEEPEHALVVANKIRMAIQRPFDNGTCRVQIDASIGVSIYPEDGTEEHVLIKHADIAMYYAKEGGGCGVRMFNAAPAASPLSIASGGAR